MRRGRLQRSLPDDALNVVMRSSSGVYRRQARSPLFDLDQCARLLSADFSPGMKPGEEPHRSEDKPPPKPSRLEEARRIIEQYAADLRGIIEKLRRKLN